MTYLFLCHLPQTKWKGYIRKLFKGKDKRKEIQWRIQLGYTVTEQQIY